MDASCNFIPPAQSQDMTPDATGDVQWKKDKSKAPKQPPRFTAKVQESAQVKAKLKVDSYAKQYAELCRDVELLRKGRLYRKYASEFNSWKRAKYDPQEGVTFDHATFGDFRNWLVHLGLRPRGRKSRDFTADRIDLEKGYAPGNVRWASVAEQNRNRKNAEWIDWAGNRYSRRAFAKFLGIPPKRLDKQIERRWPLSRIVAAAGKAIDPVEDFRFSTEILEREYRKRTEQQDFYYKLNRLDWLPRFYEDHANAAKRSDRREQFRALAADAERERQRRYAERDALQAAKQDELLEQVAPAYPLFNPLPGHASKAKAIACSAVNPTDLQSPPQKAAMPPAPTPEQKSQEWERQRQAYMDWKRDGSTRPLTEYLDESGEPRSIDSIRTAID